MGGTAGLAVDRGLREGETKRMASNEDGAKRTEHGMGKRETVIHCRSLNVSSEHSCKMLITILCHLKHVAMRNILPIGGYQTATSQHHIPIFLSPSQPYKLRMRLPRSSRTTRRTTPGLLRQARKELRVLLQLLVILGRRSGSSGSNRRLRLALRRPIGFAILNLLAFSPRSRTSEGGGEP